MPNSSHHSSTATRTRNKGVGCGPRRRHTKNSELTEESLEEFNKRNDKKITLSSPYVARHRRATSPGRESQATALTSSSSISTVLIKIHEWSTSCFRGKKKDSNVKGKAKKSELFSSIDTGVIKEAVELRNKDIVVSANTVSSTSTHHNEEKPLRERVLIAPIVVRSPVTVENKVELIQERMVAKDEERGFVWANKYRPKALKDFICNRDKAEHLISMVQTGQCSHYIFEGPHGVGKRTMVWALLREAFGAEKLMTRQEVKEFTLKGEALPSIRVNMQISSKHVEINTSELAGYEKHVVVELIKQKHDMGLKQAIKCDHTNCHAIILHEADKLSTDAQLYIRWLIERSKGCNKIFFCCHDASKLQTIKPLCKVVQLLPPSNKEIVEVLEFVAEQEGIQLPHQLAERITEKSQHNLRQAIRSFEATWQRKSDYALEEDQIIMTGWEDAIMKISKDIIEEQSPKQLYVIRGKLQCLIEHNVSPDFIFSTLVDELKRLLGDNFCDRIEALYQEYNRDSGGILGREKSLVLLRDRDEESEGKRKNIHQFLRIEEFTAKFMSWYKSSILNSFTEPNGQGGRADD